MDAKIGVVVFIIIVVLLYYSNPIPKQETTPIQETTISTTAPKQETTPIQETAPKQETTPIQETITSTIPVKNFIQYDNYNCVYARINQGLQDTNEYTYLGKFNDYNNCVNASLKSSNIDKIKSITHHNNTFDEPWKLACFGIYDKNTKVSQTGTTCGILS